MERENRLELVKRSLRLLVDQLKEGDKVGIVIYGSTGSVLLEPTSGRDKDEILSAIDRLRLGGSTYVEQGLKLAYSMAVREVETRQDHACHRAVRTVWAMSAIPGRTRS